MRVKVCLLAFALELLLESLEGAEIAEGGLLHGSELRGLLALLAVVAAESAAAGAFGTLAALGTFLGALGVFGNAAVAQDDALAALVELDYLELELVVELGLGAILLDEVLGGGEAFHAVFKRDDGALVHYFGDGALVDGAYGEDGLEDVPGVLLELLVAEAEATVVLVDFEHLHVDVVADFGELAGVLDLLGPAEVADVDEALYALLDLHEETEVGEVAHLGGVAAADGVADLDVLPGVVAELLDAEGHLALLAVDVEDYCLYFVAYLHEVLGRAEVLAPAHLADVDEALYAGCHFYECAVVGHDYHLALDVVAGLEVGVKAVPGMRGELLEAEGDALLLVVEVEDDDVDVLVELHDFAGVGYAAPAEVGDVHEAVDAAQVDEDAVGGDVLDDAFEHLALLELGDDLALLSLELCLDEGLVAYYHVAVFFVDLDDLELHGLVYEHVVVADGSHVDLGTGQEGFDAEDVHDHAALCAALDVALDDFVLLHGLFDAVPAARCAGFLVAEHQLAFLVLLVLDEYLYGVADLEVGVVAEFGDGDDAVGLVTDVNHHFALVDGDDGTFDYLFVLDRVERLVVGRGEVLAALGSLGVAVFVGGPVKVLEAFDRGVF